MLILLRRLSHCPSSLHHRHLSLISGDLSDAKLISTLFLLYPHCLTSSSLRHLITPSVAFLSIRRISNPCSALALLDLFAASVDVIPAAYSHVIELLLRSHRCLDALKLFDEMTERRNPVDPSFFHLLLTSCTKAGDLDTCLLLINRAVELRCVIPTSAFNSLLNLLLRRNQPQDAVFLFREHLRSRLYAPDTYGFNIFINACCRVGDIDGAFRRFREMGEFGCLPDTITHNALIDGLCKANRVDEGREILNAMKLDSSCSPNVKTYTSVVSGYCKLGKMEEAKDVFDEMIEFGIKPSRVTYNVLIDGYGKACNLRSALSVYERMRICGCSPDVVTFTSLILGYCRSGQFDDAMRLLHDMGENQVSPNAYTYSIIIDSLCKKNRLREARDLVKELNGRRDIIARAFIYNPVIDGYCRAGDVEEANLILVEMEERGCRPDKYTYTILIIGHCMKGRTLEALGLFNRMVATECAPDSVTVNSFVSLLLKAGMPSEANRISAMASGKDMGSNVSPLKEIPVLLSKGANLSVAV